jgi:hypothetical protein
LDLSETHLAVEPDPVLEALNLIDSYLDVPLVGNRSGPRVLVHCEVGKGVDSRFRACV